MKKIFLEHGELDQAGLEGLSIPELVKLYNAANPDKPVKLFSKKPTAVERVWASYPDQVSATTQPEATDAPTDTKNDDVNNESNNSEDDMAKNKGTKKAPKAKKASTGGGGGRKSKIDGDARIDIKVKENPKRAGSASAKRFDKYRQNMKVSDALAAGVKSADLQWDMAHGYIALK